MYIGRQYDNARREEGFNGYCQAKKPVLSLFGVAQGDLLLSGTPLLPEVFDQLIRRFWGQEARVFLVLRRERLFHGGAAEGS